MAGVLIPASAIVVELTTHISREIAFDPLPTVHHALAAISVPLINSLLWLRLRMVMANGPGWGITAGFAAGTAAIFSIPFLPIAPIAIPAVLLVGLGLLPLAPILAAGASIHAARALPWRTVTAGVVCAIGMFAALEWRSFLTRTWLKDAVSSDAGVRSNALQRLRSYASPGELEEACRFRRRASFFANLTAPSVTSQEARRVYYRITGREFRDADNVAWPRTTVQLTSSRIDGSIDALAQLAYLEWTAVFTSTAVQGEARALLELPEGAVVSRATLWVDGEPREAVFGERGAVRRAYAAVVATRRDPLLVTTAGTDRVLVQCFPVPVGGEMKIRIGITTPLTNGRLDLPRLVDRNFGSAKHSIWIESKAKLTGPGLIASPAPAGGFAVRATVNEPETGEAPLWVQTASSGAAEAWTPLAGSSEDVIRQYRSAVRRPTPRTLAVVVEGSAELGRHAPAIDTALRRELPGTSVEKWFCGDSISRVRRFHDQPFRGGVDCGPVIASIAERDVDAIVWIHGTQPAGLSAGQTGALEQMRERGRIPPIYTIAALAGAHDAVQALDALTLVLPVRRRGDLSRDLSAFIESLGAEQPVWVRERGMRATVDPGSPRTSAHLVNLWAANEVRRLLHQGSRPEAVALASEHRLVTPVTGAVVLERDQQYVAMGLTPPGDPKVPGVPEPETWALLIACLAAVALVGWQRRRQIEPCPR